MTTTRNKYPSATRLLGMASSVFACLLATTGCADLCFDDGWQQKEEGCEVNADTEPTTTTTGSTSTSLDGSTSLNMTGGMSMGSNDASGGTSGGGSTTGITEECSPINVEVTYPTVQFIIDQNFNMENINLEAGLTNWEATEAVTTAMVSEFQFQVRFGGTLFEMGQLGEQTCSAPTEQPPQLIALVPFSALLNQNQPGIEDFYPTDEALTEAHENFVSNAHGTEDNHFVLIVSSNATDCIGDNDEAVLEQTAEQIFANDNIRIHTIGLGTNVDAVHLEQVASNGGGRSSNPQTQAELEQAIRDVFSTLRDCEHQLDQPVDMQQEQDCTLFLNGEQYEFASSEWSLLDPQTLLVEDALCSTLQTGTYNLELRCMCDAS